MKEYTRRLTYTAMALGFALMASYFERSLPALVPALPGVKLGLGNFVVLSVLYLMSAKTALWINILKVIILGLLFTGLFAMGYAMCGALLSFALMVMLKRIKAFGIVGVSVAGGVGHNLGQILFAALIMNDYRLFIYLPVLIISGVAAGGVIGWLSGMFVRRVLPILPRLR